MPIREQTKSPISFPTGRPAAVGPEDRHEHWYLAYRFGGMQKKLAGGAYPQRDLKDARAWREANKRLLTDGIGPGQQRKAAAAPRPSARPKPSGQSPMS